MARTDDGVNSYNVTSEGMQLDRVVGEDCDMVLLLMRRYDELLLKGSIMRQWSAWNEEDDNPWMDALLLSRDSVAMELDFMKDKYHDPG